MDPITLIGIITASIKAGETLVQYIQRLRERMKQDAELTPEQEAAFDEALNLATQQPHWKTDANP